MAHPCAANQDIPKAESRDGHAVRTLWAHPPTHPYPALSAEANLSPKVIAGSDITRVSTKSYKLSQSPVSSCINV